MKKLIYAGIGSRKTPKDALSVMHTTAMILAHKGYTLRSGGALGADQAFESGCDDAKGRKEVYYPGNLTDNQRAQAKQVYAHHQMVTMTIMNNWEDWYARLLLRNVQQILGPDPVINKDPVNFVIFYAPITGPHKGDVSGGTRWAVQLAYRMGIPVNNLADPNVMEKTQAWIKDNYPS